MGNRPKNPANARNKNVLVVGGSGSGKTRFWLKPNLLQCHSSYVVTDPKGDIVIDCGQALLKNGYSIRIFNTINFRKSMHYNPFAYIHSEKDILKLTTTLIANTKGDGKAGDEFWTKAETLLYCALIGYIHYEAPLEEQNFATLIEFLNAMEVREDDETFQNPVDQMFEALKKKKPNHFAVRQYAKFKLAAGAEHSKSSFARDMMGRESNVILIDEFDKVNPALYNAFYELFDEGKYVDTNYSVELGQAIFLLTCNFSNENEIKKALGPAMFSRIGCCVEYADLTVEQKQKIVNNWYDSIMASLKDDERVYIETTDIHEWFLKNAERYDNIRILKSKMENAIFEKLTDHFIIMTGSMAEGTQDRV